MSEADLAGEVVYVVGTSAFSLLLIFGVHGPIFGIQHWIVDTVAEAYLLVAVPLIAYRLYRKGSRARA